MSPLPWDHSDTAIVVTAAMAAMSCALPGVWLVLRQQSMMGDALSHTALPGVVVSFLVLQSLRAAGWLTAAGLETLEPICLAIGAVLMGMLTAVLTEWVQRLGRVESNAALGVVFTSLFALGLLLVRLKADDVHIDPDCVLFGQLELVVWNEVSIGPWKVPLAAITNGSLLVVNLILTMLFFKELRLATFDGELATSLGIPSGLVNYLLMGLTAATVVLAFESVGSILVVALLIVPAASALLVCRRLAPMIAVTLILAALSALFGHVLARTVPHALFSRIGFPQVQDAGTSGMMAVACGLFFGAIFVFSPRSGLAGRWFSRLGLRLRMAADDILSTLYRFEESVSASPPNAEQVAAETSWIGPLVRPLTLWQLRRRGLIESGRELRLTPSGREQAALLVRAHRLWESYMHKHFNLPSDHLHETAHLVEHYLDQNLRTQLDQELDSPHVDPHGKSIPDPSAE